MGAAAITPWPIAAEAGVTVLRSEAAGRAIQMNHGRPAATGDLLCFLHADTLMPDDLVIVAERTLADPRLPAPASFP